MDLVLLHAYLIFLALLHQTCNASRSKDCPPSSCGNILNISYPFRLKTDPKHCGNKHYELSCESNLPVLYLYSAKYHVQAIHYNNFTIRVVDADLQKDNCSSLPSPDHSLIGSTFSYSSSDGLYTNPYELYNPTTSGSVALSQSIVFLKCASPVHSPLYIDASTCINGTYPSSSSHLEGYSYAKLGPTMMSELMDSCRIETMVMVSLLPKVVHYISYMDIHKSIVYGFELSWMKVCCEKSPELICNPNNSYYSTCSSFSAPYPWWGSRHQLYYAEIVLGGLLMPLNYLLFSLGIPTIDVFEIEDAKGLLAYVIALLIYLLALLVVCRVMSVCCWAPCAFAFLIYKWRRRHLSMHDNVEEFLQTNDNFMPIRYSYSDIKKMTKSFKDNLAEGGYGSVYKGKLRSGHFAAIKMLGKSKANGQDFINEVATIGRIHHVNVVRLIGYCAERSKRALVYEFMPNGSLDKYVFPKGGNVEDVSNEKMLEISLGIAHGIEYLHRGCDMQILHFDIKPHNILLDENFIPKVSDFGLAKLCPTDKNSVSLTAARGTMGYMAPELLYKNIGGISYKADVYSFGMLLMEMVARRKNLDAFAEMVARRKNLDAFAENSSQIYFPSWAYDQCNKGKDVELADDATDDGREVRKKMIIAALWCIQLKPDDRPSMRQVVQMLEADVGSLKLPPKPTLSLQDQNPKKETEAKPTPAPSTLSHQQSDGACSSSSLPKIS